MYAYEEQHLAALRPYLPECAVLLKKNGAFPLSGPGTIAAYGSGVRGTVKGGTGSGDVNSRYYVTVEQGLKAAGFTVTTGNWLDGMDRITEHAHSAFVKEIRERARKKHTIAAVEGMGAVMPTPEYVLPLCEKGDAAIYVVSRISGEGNDRRPVKGDYMLTDSEVRDILALDKKFSRFMLVINAGGPVDLSPVMSVGNILVLSQLGTGTGSVLADLLLGKAYPSGKLTTTWAAADRLPDTGDFGNEDDTCYKEGIYVGYRWYDAAGVKPLFPFGFGLGYTGFRVTADTCTVIGSSVSVTAKVKNTGRFPGKQTVQAYVSAPAGKLDKPYQTLAGWAKTGELQPGDEADVKIIFQMKDLASYDESRSAYILEAGNYAIRLGTSSRNTTVCAAIQLPEEVVTRQVRNAFGKSGFQDWIPAEAAVQPLPEDVPVLTVEPEDIRTQTVSYDPAPAENAALNSLTDEQLVRMNIGWFNPKGGIAGVIGDAAQDVPGAAGETSEVYEAAGAKRLVMADGPAGLRLTQHFYTDKKGKHAIGSAIPAGIMDFTPVIAQKAAALVMRGPKKGVPVSDQFCTAIPIGTAIAQSWNTEFARLCGDIVGREMELFGVDLWLAPALNIHRSVLCGRNFEYYSEDPLLSGRFAAAVTNGVQKHPGRGTTIKHFAANNQETNRYSNSSNVSERAMREIYLRGFEVCIRESHPAALMTSYNLINGLHTSESRALTTDILRCEWGYKGIVMTDWVISLLAANHKYAAPDPAKVAAAGCSLYMPGSKKDFERMLAGLEDGTVTRAQLIENAARVLEFARKR